MSATERDTAPISEETEAVAVAAARPLTDFQVSGPDEVEIVPLSYGLRAIYVRDAEARELRRWGARL